MLLDINYARPSQTTRGDDEDKDLQSITYSCLFKSNLESTYKDCQSSLRGLTFDKEKGELDWKTDYFLAGEYFFKIKGEDNDPLDPKFDTKEFKVTVNNVNRAPKLAMIKDRSVNENEVMSSVNSKDISILVTSIEKVRKDKSIKTED